MLLGASSRVVSKGTEGGSHSPGGNWGSAGRGGKANTTEGNARAMRAGRVTRWGTHAWRAVAWREGRGGVKTAREGVGTSSINPNPASLRLDGKHTRCDGVFYC